MKNPASPSEGKSRPSTSRSTKERNRNNGVQSSSPREQSQTPTSPRSPSRPLMIPDRHKSAGATPRLPTYEPKESTKDFADFIRSTGPDNGGATINASQQITVRSPNAIRYQQRPISTPRSVSSPSNMEGISMEGRSRASSKSVRRLQPREPQVSASTKESSELAAFIRQGPPPGSDVTPKKLNMSSMSPLADHSRTGTNNRLMISPSSYHTQGSSVQTKSERSSSNSRTGLLENKEKENPNMYMERCQASVDDKAQKQLGVTDPPQSQRKQRRVKDPYAIPTDSDEEYAPEPQSKSKRNEESLMDFLNSVPPPAQSALNTPTPTDSPAPEVAASSKPWKEAQKAQGTPKVGPRTLQKKQSGQGLVSRFGRSSASPKVAVEPKSSNNAKSTTNGVNHRESTGPPQLSLNRAGSSTLFSGPNSFVSVNGANIPSTINPTPPITSSSPDQNWKENKARGLAPPVAAGPQIGSMRGKAGRSNDLIEFLNAGPPPGVTSPISSPAMIKEETGFRQMFGRMKKNKKAVT